MTSNLLSIVPANLAEHDPRSFAIKYRRSIRKSNANWYNYNQKLQKFEHYNRIKFFEQFAHNNARLLVPAACLHWKRRKKFKCNDRHVKIGRNHYYMVEPELLNENEYSKFLTHVDAAQNAFKTRKKVG